MNTITFVVDLAKQVFSVCEMDERGAVQQRQDMRREGFAAWIAQRSANTTGS
jgi:transposase